MRLGRGSTGRGTATRRTGRSPGAAGRSPRPADRRNRSRVAAPRRTPPPAPEPRRRGSLTARAAVLAVALATVVLALALPFKVWLAQRGQIDRLEQQTLEQKARVAALQAQRDRWQDPAYVRAQARERLHMVMPGETAYVVLGGPPPASTSQRPGVPKTVPAVSSNAPWYSALWHTVEVAGAPLPAKPPAKMGTTAPARKQPAHR